MDTLPQDPRIARLPFMSSPIPAILTCLAYLIFVKILGPAWMRSRKPYDLRGLIIVHNFFLVIASAWMFYKFVRHGWYWSWTCAGLDYLEAEDSSEIIKVAWYFGVSKVLEMADTVFSVLRKKHSQVTFLHVIHHASTPLMIWYCCALGCSGYNILYGILNSFVHIWMYLYYGLAAVGPSIQKHLWWKKYLTLLQILQFCLVILGTISAIVAPGCRLWRREAACNLGPALLFLVLFSDFYRNSYKKK